MNELKVNLMKAFECMVLTVKSLNSGGKIENLPSIIGTCLEINDVTCPNKHAFHAYTDLFYEYFQPSTKETTYDFYYEIMQELIENDFPVFTQYQLNVIHDRIERGLVS